jgi:uncharacterized glyoxalase superfamily protein PhnB
MIQETPISASAYGASLQGLGLNLIVNDVTQAIRFATQVLGAQIFFRTDVFAAMKLGSTDFMFHIPESYRGNELHATLKSDAARGIGVELRCYDVDPDRAEQHARESGYTVLAGSIDKHHGLRECMILDDDGYVWIPSRPLSPTT